MRIFIASLLCLVLLSATASAHGGYYYYRPVHPGYYGVPIRPFSRVRTGAGLLAAGIVLTTSAAVLIGVGASGMARSDGSVAWPLVIPGIVMGGPGMALTGVGIGLIATANRDMWSSAGGRVAINAAPNGFQLRF